MGRVVGASELIINGDGTIFHLHLKPEQIADKIILVGDPARSRIVADHFDTIEHKAANREFHTYTGTYAGKRISVISTGMGVGNLDILMGELDALANIDLCTRTVSDTTKSLTLVRLGTCGALQDDIALGDVVASRTSVSFDGLASYYDNHHNIYNQRISEALAAEFGSPYRAKPVAIDLCQLLTEALGYDKIGITASALGFYGPQGRSLRLKPSIDLLTDKLASFRVDGQRIVNLEMESATLASLSAMMGHKAATLCLVVAQRGQNSALTNYHQLMDGMIERVLKILTSGKI